MWAGIRRDFAGRRNIDIYVTVGVAIAVSVLSFFDVLSPQKVASLTLMVLGVLAYSTLATRTVVEAAESNAGVNRFAGDFPPELRPMRESSVDSLLIGLSLGRTIETSYGAFKSGLSRGWRLRIVLTSPDADPSAIDARCKLSRPEIAEQRAEIRRSLRELEALRAAMPDAKLEVRLTRTAMKFGLNDLNIDSPRETLFVQMYSFRLPGESRPHFTLTRADGEWFDCFKQQAEAMWDEAIPYAFDGEYS